LSWAKELSSDAFTLRENLNGAFDKIRQFNDREALFNQSRSEYPDLDALNTEFKPFYDLLYIASEAEWRFSEWKQGPFLKQDANEITSLVNQWHQNCF